jgi:hypothetical protein
MDIGEQEIVSMSRQRTAAGQRRAPATDVALLGLDEQLRPVGMDEVAQLALERLGFAGQRTDAFDLFAMRTLTVCGNARGRPLRCSWPG